MATATRDDPRRAVETIILFKDLDKGDVYSFNGQVWMTVTLKPSVYDKKRMRWVLRTEEYGLSFAQDWSKVWVKRFT